MSLNTRRCPAKRAKAEACHLEGADHAGEEGHSKGDGISVDELSFTESRYEDVLAFYMKAITDRPTVRPSPPGFNLGDASRLSISQSVRRIISQ